MTCEYGKTEYALGKSGKSQRAFMRAGGRTHLTPLLMIWNFFFCTNILNIPSSTFELLMTKFYDAIWHHYALVDNYALASLVGCILWTPMALWWPSPISVDLGSSGVSQCKIRNLFFAKISFAHNLFYSHPIILKFRTEHGIVTAMLCAKCEKDWMTDLDVMDI